MFQERSWRSPLQLIAVGKENYDMNDMKAFRRFYLKLDNFRVEQVRQWCRAVERKCLETPEPLWNAPLPKPLTYCGYSRSMMDYANYVSTTWFGRLVEAAFEVKLPDKTYGLETYVLCFLAREKETALTERAFTVCLEAKVY